MGPLVIVVTIDAGVMRNVCSRFYGSFIGDVLVTIQGWQMILLLLLPGDEQYDVSKCCLRFQSFSVFTLDVSSSILGYSVWDEIPWMIDFTHLFSSQVYVMRPRTVMAAETAALDDLIQKWVCLLLQPVQRFTVRCSPWWRWCSFAVSEMLWLGFDAWIIGYLFIYLFI